MPITSALQEREQEIKSSIERYAAAFGIDPNLVRGLITQESAFIAEAVSPTGAYGYGQFTGIGARQVQNIANMADCPDPEGLDTFTKRDADDPDVGIKAICATLWWLFEKKYKAVADKKVQLEAALTFYNSGGRPAALVVRYGGHAQAVPAIQRLPRNMRSNSVKYAPQVAVWYVKWYEFMRSRETVSLPVPDPGVNPFDEQAEGIAKKYRALVEALKLLDNEDDQVDCIINTRDGFTEVTLIFPGEV